MAEPDVVWTRVPMEETLRYLAPKPLVEPKYYPLGCAVVEGTVAYIGAPDKVEILAAKDGTLNLVAEIDDPRDRLDKSADWQKMRLLSDHLFIFGTWRNKSRVVDLRSGSVSIIKGDPPGSYLGFEVSGSMEMAFVWSTRGLYAVALCPLPIKP